MRRRTLTLLMTALVAAAAGAATLTRDQRQASILYLQSLRNADGGFRTSAAPAPSQVGNLTPVFRAYGYLEAEKVDRKSPVQFLESCWNNVSGAYADVPGGKVDVRSAAMGLMARVELKMPRDEHQEQCERFLIRNAETVADVYFAGAAFDAAGVKSSRKDSWLAVLEATRNPDGTYGKSAFDTATVVITRLRLGAPVNDREAVLRSLRAAQHADGGYSVTGDTSDTATTYRVMRAFHMLKEKPDLAKLRGFFAKCRNSDGGGGGAPGQPSTGTTTYHAAVVLHWADELGR